MSFSSFHPLITKWFAKRFGRIKNIESMRREIPLTSFYFDCLYREGDGPLFSVPYRRRFEILSGTVPDETVMPRVVTKDRNEISISLKLEALSTPTGHRRRC
jgi:DNA ligase-1